MQQPGLESQIAIIRALMAKRAAGIVLKKSESKLLAEFEEEQRTRVGTEWIRNMPKKLLFDWSGRQSKQWLEWHDRYNIPYVPDKSVRHVDVTKMLRWLAEFLSTHHDVLSRIANDPLVSATNTHAERYNAAKADMAEDERDMRRRRLLPREPVHQILMRWSARLRQAGDAVRRKYGNDAGDVLLDAINDCESDVRAVLDDKA